MRAAIIAVWICLCATAGAPRSASADEPAPLAPPSAEAARHFASGEAAFDRGDFERAGASFEAAYAADPHPISLWNAARSWDRGGEPVRAANLYRRFLQEAPAEMPNRDRATIALGELSKLVGRLEIVLPHGSELTVDDRPLGEARVSYVAPGAHLLSATIDASPVTKQVAVAAGETLTVVLEKPAPTAAPPRAVVDPKPPVADKPAKRGVTPWLFVPFAGATAVAGALSIWSGVDTLLALDEYEGFSEAQQIAYYPEGKAKQDRTNVLLAVTGGLGLVTTAIGLFAIDWGNGTLVGLGPSEVTVVVTF